MSNWKKMEVFIDNIRQGILNVNWAPAKKVIALSLVGIIKLTTLTGCSISSEKPVKPTEEPTDFSYSSINEEIKIKKAFVDDAFNKIDAYVGENLHNIVYNKIEPNLEEISEDEERLDPNSELGHERILFNSELTDEEIKEHIINNYDDVIAQIEDLTDPYEKKGLDEIDYDAFVPEYQETHRNCR